MSLLALRPLLVKRPMVPVSLLRNYIISTTNYQKRQTELQVGQSNSNQDVSTHVRPLGERVKENTKTATYMGIILAGVAVTGIMFYSIFKELFSSNSPNAIYSAALELCKNDPRIQDSLGMPIKGFGEETRRKRRGHVASSVYQKNGSNYMRMQFYIQGIRNKATVHLEMKENSSGNYEYRYIFAQLDYYPQTTIVLEDNRSSDNSTLAASKAGIFN